LFILTAEIYKIDNVSTWYTMDLKHPYLIFMTSIVLEVEWLFSSSLCFLKCSYIDYEFPNFLQLFTNKDNYKYQSDQR